MIDAAVNGVEVTTVCATRGEAGEIMERSGATPETLAEIREAEYRTAGKIMGVKESILLNYRDSGMAGTPENNDPRAFIQQPEDQVISDIIKVAERVRPNVMLTMDEGGGYGHPDHIFMARCSVAAFNRLRTERHTSGWAPSKLYFFAFPRSSMRAIWSELIALDPNSPMAKLDVEAMGVPDDEITFTVDLRRHEKTLREAFAAHQSQESPLDRMEDAGVRLFLHSASYIQVYPKPSQDRSAGEVPNLFDGIE